MQDILVSLGGGTAASGTTDAAARFAKFLGARLTAVYMRSWPPLPGMAAYAGGPALIDQVARETEEVRERTRQVVQSRAEAAGVDCQWLEPSEDAHGALVRASYAADMVVVTRGESGAAGGREISRLVIDSGRPVMVLPPDCGVRVPVQRVVVGWNGSRGAARALHDALPILRRAISVDLLIVTATLIAENAGEVAPSLRAHLLRHGVDAKARAAAVRPGFGVDRILLEEVLDADLLVMGAFGQPQMREFVLGSVTEQVIENASVPVLLSC